MSLADALVGHTCGGLGHVNILLSTMMGGISGSAVADAVMEAKILVPEMEKRGYDRAFAGAITAASSMITPIIPPGTGLILYAFLANASMGQMLAAGYLPGIIMCVAMMVQTYFMCKKRGIRKQRETMCSWSEIWPRLKNSS
jgi:tripartite ATP-independent transporter DctM subunit